MFNNSVDGRATGITVLSWLILSEFQVHEVNKTQEAFIKIDLFHWPKIYKQQNLNASIIIIWGRGVIVPLLQCI